MRYPLVLSLTNPVSCVGVQVNTYLRNICTGCVSTFVGKSFDGTIRGEIFTNRTFIARLKTFGFKITQTVLKNALLYSRMNIIFPHNHGNDNGIQCGYRDCLFFVTRKLLLKMAEFLQLDDFSRGRLIEHFGF
jgi:hypothetical protein